MTTPTVEISDRREVTTPRMIQIPDRRESADKLVRNVTHYIKLATGIITVSSAAFLAAVGAGSLGYAAWQDFKYQMAHDKVPRAMAEQIEEKAKDAKK